LATKLLPFITVLAFLLSACSGDDEPFADVPVLRPDQVQPLINNSEIVVGENRLVFGVVLPDGRLLVDAQMHLVFYDLTSGSAVQRFEADAVSRVPARDAGITEQVDHVHADGSRHVHLNVGEDIGFYTAIVSFDKPGNWGVEMQVKSFNPEAQITLRPLFNVIAESPTPAIGAPAPRSRNLTAADVTDLSQVDSSANPTTELHMTTIADAIASGRPSLVLFAVPGFCQSRLCGPEMEIMRKLHAQHKDEIEFIHVEAFKNPGSPNREVVETMNEWNLRTEPWFFLIDGQGIVRAKFEGPAGLEELQQAIDRLF
jgi:hypothetical protein